MMRKLAWSAVAVSGTLIFWALIRIMFPVLAYYPPDVLAQALSPSVFVQIGIQEITMAAYGFVALVVLFLFFAVIQNGVRPLLRSA